MTAKQKQCLLAYLGYYVGEIDGKWGTLSKVATEAFQQDYGLKADGIFGAKTEVKILSVIASGEPPVQNDSIDSWDDIKYFKRSEFKCKCGEHCNGYPAEVDLRLAKVCDAIREHFGKPARINSGLRCKQHNANVGGATRSQHLYGTAADIGTIDGTTPEEMAAFAETLLPNTGGIGIYSWGIHVDVRGSKSRWSG